MSVYVCMYVNVKYYYIPVLELQTGKNLRSIRWH